jgi:hypothetical protein
LYAVATTAEPQHSIKLYEAFDIVFARATLSRHISTPRTRAKMEKQTAEKKF